MFRHRNHPRYRLISKGLLALPAIFQLEFEWCAYRVDLFHAGRLEGARRFVLLHEAYVGDRGRLGDFADGAKLLLVPPDIFVQRAQDSLGVSWTYDHARNQLALRHIRKDIDKMYREFFRRVV